ncbi:MAG: hypothetical protein RBU24_13020 [Kiritimatiellia bacterium]|jgi:hypothetical protein|nr:hypothetical protein [Kiritimatiellia bacterium]
MKAGLREAGLVLLVTLLVPQVFVLAYFYPLLITGPDRGPLWQVLAELGLSISWVSAPFFLLVTVLYRVSVARRVPGAVVFLTVFAAGYVGVALWNRLVFDLFGYLRSALPLLLCCSATAGYALVRRAYRTGLPAVR